MPSRQPFQQAASSASTSIPALPPKTSTRPHPDDIRAEDLPLQSQKLCVELARFLCFFTDPKTGRKYFKGIDVNAEDVSGINEDQISVRNIFTRIYDCKYANAGEVLLDIELCLEQVEDERKESLSTILDTLWSFFETFPTYHPTDGPLKVPSLSNLDSPRPPAIGNHEGFLHLSDYLAKYMMENLEQFTGRDNFYRWSYMCNQAASSGLLGMDREGITLKSWLEYLQISSPTRLNYEAFLVPIQLAFLRLDSQRILEDRASQPSISTSILNSSFNTINFTSAILTSNIPSVTALTSSAFGSVDMEDWDEDLQEEADVEGSLLCLDPVEMTRVDVKMEVCEDERIHFSPEPPIRSILDFSVVERENFVVNASFFSTPSPPTSIRSRPDEAVSSPSPRESLTSSSPSSRGSCSPASSSELDEPCPSNQLFVAPSSSPSPAYNFAGSEPPPPSSPPGHPSASSSVTTKLPGNSATPTGQKRKSNASGASTGLASTSTSTSSSSAPSSSLSHPSMKKFKSVSFNLSNPTVSGPLPQHQPVASGSSIVVPQANPLALVPPTPSAPARLSALEAIDACTPAALRRDNVLLRNRLRAFDTVKEQFETHKLEHRKLKQGHASWEARSRGQECELKLVNGEIGDLEKIKATQANKIAALKADLNAEKLQTQALSTSLAASETARTAVGTELDLAKLKIDGLTTALQKATASVTTSGTELSACQEALDSEERVTEDLKGSLAFAKEALATSREEGRSLQSELHHLALQNKELALSLSDTNVNLDKSRAKAASRKLVIQQLRTSGVELESSLASAKTKLSDLKRLLGSMVTVDEYTDLQIEFCNLEDRLATETQAHSKLRALAFRKDADGWKKPSKFGSTTTTACSKR